jgi:hypothetical protein
MDRDIQRFRVGINSPIIRPNNYGTLTNINSTSCYLNTSLQMLYRIHTLRFMLDNINLNNQRLIELARVNEDLARGRTILRILKHIFTKFSRGDRYINLVNEGVYRQLVLLSGLTCNAQQDMTEFIVNILGIISQFYGNQHVRNFMDSITFNQIDHTICENGKNVIRDPMVLFDERERIGQLPKTLELPINDRARNIQQLIIMNQQAERIEPPNNMLDSCIITNGRGNYNRRAISKQTIINELPSSEYFLISLKRRLPEDAYGTSFYKKKNIINVNPYLIIGNGKYQIIGCGLHMGNANGGHYVYIAYNNECIPVVTFNDERFYLIREEELAQINTDGYMFLYKKIAQATPAEIAQSLLVPFAQEPVAAVLRSSNLQEIRRKIEQIKGKIREIRINPDSPNNIMNLNIFTLDAIQLYTRLSETEKRNIGGFIPIEAIPYLDIRIPDNLIS